MKLIKEACIGNIKDVKKYLDKLDQIDRFETCSKLNLGGLTPSKRTFKFIVNKANNLDQIVMIRTNNSFTIKNDNEIKKLKKHIKKFLKLGAKNFIFGYLTDDNKIDIDTCKKLIDVIKREKNTTWNFHMAIDLVDSYFEEIDKLINLGFTRILTKGGSGPAIENVENLKKINEKYGNKIEILVGGKVTKDNYLEIEKQTKIRQFHGREIA